MNTTQPVSKTLECNIECNPTQDISKTLECLFYHDHDNPYPAYGIFNFKNENESSRRSILDEAESYREYVASQLQVEEVLDELNSFRNTRDSRKFMRRLQVSTVSDIIPRMMELSVQSHFQAEYACYMADPEKWNAEHKGLGFEHFWEMMYRVCAISRQGFVEY
jgi:hypothetical protein